MDLLDASYIASEVAIQELRDQVNVDVSEVASQNCAVCLDPLGGAAVVRWSDSGGFAGRQPMRAGRGRASTRDLPSGTNGYTFLWTRGGSACTTTYPVSTRG